MRKHYDEELEKLHELLVDMGNLCQEAIVEKQCDRYSI